MSFSHPSYRIASILGLTVALILPIASAHAQSFTINANGLPELNSNASALGAAFLDFDGGTFNGTTLSPFGGDSTFNSAEQTAIYETWRDVAAHFAMFDINVTTVAPNKNDTPTAHLIISPDYTNASAQVGTFGSTGADATGGVNSPGWISGRSTVATHELGHIMGLSHQSVYDSSDVKTAEYRGSDALGRAPLMGVDYGGPKYARWEDGFTGEFHIPQDDMAVIRDALNDAYNTLSFGTYFVGGGDGFRDDDHGNTQGSATTLSLVSQSGFVVSSESEGIIERHADVDMFKLAWNGGDLTMTAEAQRQLDGFQTHASSLGMTLAMYNDQGQIVGAEDNSVDASDVDAALSFNDLGAGTYYFAVGSNGDYEDLGAYTVELAGQVVQSVPEPTSFALLSLGALTLGSRRRR